MARRGGGGHAALDDGSWTLGAGMGACAGSLPVIYAERHVWLHSKSRTFAQPPAREGFVSPDVMRGNDKQIGAAEKLGSSRTYVYRAGQRHS